jgi:polyhydroxybutyrate depolymerase
MDTTAASGRHLMPLAHDGVERPYLLQVPPDSAAGPLPLLVQLHGRGIDPVQFDRLTGFGALADEKGLALAMPSALGEIWNDGRDAAPESMRPDDVGYLAAVIGDAAARLPIDQRRVYVAGMSNGAAMAGRMACERAELIAGIAQVAGTAGVNIVAATRPARPVPIISIHGTADRVAPYQGGIRRGLLPHVMIRRAAGPSVGVDDWAAFWVAADGATTGPSTTTLPPEVTIRTWHGPTPQSDVVFYRLEGCGHTWPGAHIPLPALLFGRTSRTIDAAAVCWEFLTAHSG